MSFLKSVADRLPKPVLDLAIKHQAMLKFAVVGGSAYIVDTGTWYLLMWTVLPTHVLTAKAIGIVVATIFSYVLNREWSFSDRNSQALYREAILFFGISGIGAVVNLIPLGISRYVLNLQQPYVSLATQEIATFIAGSILGTLLAMVFRYWAFDKFVFPHDKSAGATVTELPKAA
ncbi:GtrA family protein [Pseudonocardiaceae bacterium YIM PH 21723]|nr:GtrA family protein [Pseudonocardiaceae bacterium YIM PH 21723]